MKTGTIALAALNFTARMELPLSKGLALSVIGICVVMVELALIALLILVMAKIISLFSKKGKKEAQAEVSAPAVNNTVSDNTVDLIDVDEPTAAAIMAIVSDKSGIPIERLKFKYIKKTEDK